MYFENIIVNSNSIEFFQRPNLIKKKLEREKTAMILNRSKTTFYLFDILLISN